MAHTKEPHWVFRQPCRMTAKCIGCGLVWSISTRQKIPATGYICPHCESKLRAGATLEQIQSTRGVPGPQDYGLS